MPGISLKVEEFCKTVIQDKIDAGGLAFKKPATGIVLFYAGASEEIIKRSYAKNPSITLDKHIPNWKKAPDEADRLDARRIDDTFLFDYLMSVELEKDLVAAAGIGGRQIKEAKKLIWDFVSDKFSHTDFQEAATFVCGAEDSSSFILKEMLGMLDGGHLKVLNKRHADLFREFILLGKDEVQRLMCMTYLLELKSYAEANKDPKALELYERERSYFLIWREDKRTKFKTRPKCIRLAYAYARKEILKGYKKGVKLLPPAPSSPAISFPTPANVP